MTDQTQFRDASERALALDRWVNRARWHCASDMGVNAYAVTPLITFCILNEPDLPYRSAKADFIVGFQIATINITSPSHFRELAPYWRAYYAINKDGSTELWMDWLTHDPESNWPNG